MVNAKKYIKLLEKNFNKEIRGCADTCEGVSIEMLDDERKTLW